MNIGPYSVEDYMHLAKSFHGSIAPGIMIGGLMVDLARSELPDGVLFDAISETKTCLPDALQLLTPCTIGNGWLKVMDFGRFALCLYDKYEGKGVRVFLDPEKLESWPEIKAWFFKLKPKSEQDPDALRDQIIEAGPDILTVQHITVDTACLQKKGKGAIAVCPSCKEAYPAKDGQTCLACQGNSPYRQEPRDAAPGLRIVSTTKNDRD
ncbi:MAG: formylmethanofuran dehydrogenase subunit E family protein [Desulfomonilia bacterium]|jgi:formylmethanofuran dehydrogenase subunit E|nr:formylmethanofuran dehydrogenase subunit E family protein [Deltaproteobacteria bacterium]MDX9760678.1 formylmethanofuran dehydrogenase subunit E family protein [Desulfomonilia bacterium]HPX19433.1 formylmethanofuran dehydrogenase subunit E family protein [Deltaproteobacteria bacterium]